MPSLSHTPSWVTELVLHMCWVWGHFLWYPGPMNVTKLHENESASVQNLIFIWKVSHLDSFWNRGTRELGNGLLVAWSMEEMTSLSFKAGLKSTNYACIFFIRKLDENYTRIDELCQRWCQHNLSKPCCYATLKFQKFKVALNTTYRIF